MEILHIENLSFTYPKCSQKALDNVSLSIEEGSFTVVCGVSGCGKTTLLKMIKKELSPFGEKDGSVFYKNKNIDDLDSVTAAKNIGYVMQNPDSQIVTDTVWHEMAFGLENLGYDNTVIRRKIGEMTSYFGLENIFHKKTNEISGGQKQLLNLASIMVMQPEILLLDEPTSALDPIAAADFIATLKKMNQEFGITIILVEHRLEEVFAIADSVVLMENGRILINEPPEKISSCLKNISSAHPMLSGLPSAARIFSGLNIDDKCPLTVREGKMFLSKHFSSPIQTKYIPTKCTNCNETIIETKNIWFRYERDLPDILQGVDLKIFKNEIFCILGGNGTGKTTLLNALAGINKAYRGKIVICSKKIKDYKGNELYRQNLSLLVQNPQDAFIKSTVKEDYFEILKANEIPKDEWNNCINKISEKLNISHLLEKHPYDLSGGEQQKCAIGKLLLANPKILLLDEPTKGFDAHAKNALIKILRELKKDGITIILVTHDIEFAANVGDRCSLFFDGKIISCDAPDLFFSNNSFYTTAANRISRHLFENTVTCEQVISLCKLNGEKNEKNN